MIWLRRRRVVVGKIIIQENRVFWFVVTPLRNWWGGFLLVIRKGIRYRKESKDVWYNKNNYNDIFVSFDFKKSGFRRVSSRNIRFAQFNVRLTISFKIVINFFLRAENFQLMILDRPFSLYTYKEKPQKTTKTKKWNQPLFEF